MALSDHLRAKDWTFAGTSRVAQRRNEFALYVLLGSLGMFFFAALLGYVLIRLQAAEKLQQVGQKMPALHLPWILWVSTAFAIAGSSLLWRSLRSVRRERQDLFRPQLTAAFLLGAAFCTTQTVGLTALMREHIAVMKARPSVASEKQAERQKPTIIVPPLGGFPQNLRPVPAPNSEYPVRNRPGVTYRLEGLLFVLILLHGLHFMAGMIALTIVTIRGWKGRYDHEYHGGVRMCALYWRFLDVVWIAMFGTFLLTA
jgi:heme/copper-type cytochrome/quinol oxidase subunit 3